MPLHFRKYSHSCLNSSTLRRIDGLEQLYLLGLSEIPKNRYRLEDIDDLVLCTPPHTRLDATALIHKTINSEQFSEA
jgi:hypothetical protein